MRHIAVAALRQIEFSGTHVAAALGLSAAYVATLHQRALRDGTAALVRPAGRPRETVRRSGTRRGQWRAAGVRDAEIARRLGVQQSTVLRRLGPAHVQDRAGAGGRCRDTGRPAASRRTRRRPVPEPCSGRSRGPVPPEPVPPACDGPQTGGGSGGALPVCGGDAAARVRVAGRAGDILPQPRPGRTRRRRTCAAGGGQCLLRARRGDHRAVKHLAPAEAGPLAGLSALPALRTLRPRAGRDRRPRRPAGAAADVRPGDAGREPGDLRRVLRR